VTRRPPRERWSYIPDDVATSHQTRLGMIFSILDTMFAGHWPQATALDVACHEGYSCRSGPLSMVIWTLFSLVAGYVD